MNHIMEMRFVIICLASVSLSTLFGMFFVDVPENIVAADKGASWQALPSPWRAQPGNTVSRLTKLSIWGAGSGIPALNGKKTGELSPDGVLKARVEWIFNGIISEGTSRYVLIAEKQGAEAKPFVIGDTLPKGELLEAIGFDWLRFSIPEDEGSQPSGVRRQLYEVNTK